MARGDRSDALQKQFQKSVRKARSRGIDSRPRNINQKVKDQTKGIKTIFEKGEGAFETNPQSVRPNMNKQQWAYARVYAAVNPKSKAYKIDKVHLVKR